MVDLPVITRSANPTGKVKLFHENALVLPELARLCTFFVAREFHNFMEGSRLFVDLIDWHLVTKKKPPEGGKLRNCENTQTGGFRSGDVERTQVVCSNYRDDLRSV